MCFFSKISKTATELQNRFNAKFENENEFQPSNYNGFEFPKTPVITNSDIHKIQLFYWGLIPHWAKDTAIRKNTLNARIETIHEKPSFKNSINNRCLVITDGFYEWQWLDEKGKNKKKYLITLLDNKAFAFAGLWNEWVDKGTGEKIKTYTILTTEANELLSIIHNSKKRMPVILNEKNEMNWLNGNEISSEDIELKAMEMV
jgi:putative SOS response-associated peptidase YedK